MALEHNRARGILGLALFALWPLPSVQLFEAAGLTSVRLLPFTLVFFAGRLVSYMTSPLGLLAQVVMLAGLVALMRANWEGARQQEMRLLERTIHTSLRPPNLVTSKISKRTAPMTNTSPSSSNPRGANPNTAWMAGTVRISAVATTMNANT